MNVGEKLKTPSYIQSIREDVCDNEEAVQIILKECGIPLVPPINVWEIARKLDFKVFEGEFKEESLSGIMIDSKKKIKGLGTKRAIVLNKHENSKAQAFTIAHEIAHFVLHCDESKEFFEAYHVTKDKDQSRSKGKDQDELDKERRIENEADSFAASLLMPAFLFKLYYKLISENTVDITTVLSKIFMVEEEAVRRRYKEVGIAYGK